MVITSLTRNQVVEQSAREFESHRLRHEPVCGQCPQQAFLYTRKAGELKCISALRFPGVLIEFHFMC